MCLKKGAFDYGRVGVVHVFEFGQSKDARSIINGYLGDDVDVKFVWFGKKF